MLSVFSIIPRLVAVLMAFSPYDLETAMHIDCLEGGLLNGFHRLD